MSTAEYPAHSWNPTCITCCSLTSYGSNASCCLVSRCSISKSCRHCNRTNSSTSNSSSPSYSRSQCRADGGGVLERRHLERALHHIHHFRGQQNHSHP